MNPETTAVSPEIQSAPAMITTALVSVFSKEGLEPVIQRFNELGTRLLSTGGTYDFIRNQGAEAQKVEDLTGFPSIFGGRVKTLHPAVFGGILQRRENATDQAEAQQHGIGGIDLVVVDLYPFEKTLAEGASHEDIIEKIDIGGVSLLRAAAKNYKDVAVISSPEQYGYLLEVLNRPEPGFTLEERRRLAAQAIAATSRYDLMISGYLAEKPAGIAQAAEALYGAAAPLRYGENPHQPAAFLGDLDGLFERLNGKEISYNNLLDLDAGLNLVRDFAPELEQGQVCCAILKHNNACGIALSTSAEETWKLALAADPVSAFGGVIIFNTKIDKATAQAVNEIFFEILVAPAFEPEALEVLKTKKNRIILRLKDFRPAGHQLRTMLNGLGLQKADDVFENEADLRSVTQRNPTPDETRAMLFAARVVKHTRSNAIVLATADRLIASGMGQTSRVDALRQAISKAKSFNFALQGTVMASDAFFPFPDCVEIAQKEGITAVVQPGGSVRDQDSIDACNSFGMAMSFTGRRHFKH